MNFLKTKMGDVGYVAAELANDIWRLTTTTKPGRFVASCVAHVMERSADSEMMPNDSTRQDAISEIHRHGMYFQRLRDSAGTLIKGDVSEVDSTQPPS